MTGCSKGQATLHFEDGTVIRPYEVDFYTQRAQFDYARIRISQEAGALLSSKATLVDTPVEIRTGGEKLARLLFTKDSLSVSGDQNSAYIRLEDCLLIFSRATIDKTFGGSWSEGVPFVGNSVTLEDIVEYLFNHVMDQVDSNSITGWEFTDGVDGDDVPRTYASSGLFNRAGDRGRIGSLFEGLTNAGLGAQRMINDWSGLGEEDADFDFRDDPVLDALLKIREHYGLEIFTKQDGIMYVGSPDLDYNHYFAGFPRGMHNLVGYSVPPMDAPIGGVVVKGSSERSSGESMWDMGKDDDALRSEAVALRTDIDHGQILQFDDRVVPQGETLEKVARRKLYETIEETNNGSASIDVLSSNPQFRHIRNVRVGDFLTIPDHADVCHQSSIPGSGRRYPGGVYYISRIHHKIGPRIGWNATLHIADYVNYDSITSYSYKFDPTSEEFIVDGSAIDADDVWGVVDAS